MPKQWKPSRIGLSVFETFSWPVKIRGRARQFLLAPRESPIFPAGPTFQKQAAMVLRTLELPEPRPCRRAPEEFEWLIESLQNRRRKP